MAYDRIRRALAALALALAPIVVPSFARADVSAADKETARVLMDRGDERMDAKDYAAAAKAYAEADAIMHLPMTGVSLATAQADAGLLVEALDVALAVARSAPAPGETKHYAKARADAAALAEQLAGRIPSIQLVIASPPEGLEVSIDGVKAAAAVATEIHKINPGKHQVVASAPGFEPTTVEVNVGEGVAKKIPITLTRTPGAPVTKPSSPATPLPPGPPLPREGRSGSVSVLVPIGFGIGGAGLVAGAITGGISIAKTSSARAICKNDLCPRGSLTAANTFANVANVTLGVGLAGVVVGVVGVVLTSQNHRSSSAQIEPMIGPGALGVQGSF